MINPEILFKLLEERNWDQFLKVLQAHKNEIHGNPVANQALHHFHLEYEKDIQNEGTYNTKSLKTIYLFQMARIYKFPDNMFNKAMEKLLNQYKEKSLKKAYDLAVSIDHITAARKIINEYSKTQPTQVDHSQSGNILLATNAEETVIGKTINLFKSRQEINFFRAVVSSFPNYHTYPNVAISCLIDFESIKQELTSNEKNYFFTSIVDCVVFDISDGYKPKYFFEVDSIYHDSEEQKKKDRQKDKYFSLCGEILFRVRPLSKEATEGDFKQLVSESIKEKI